MTSLSNFTSEIRPIEFLTEGPLTTMAVQELVHRLRSDPDLRIMLAAPTETSSMRAIEKIGHALIDFGIPFSTDSASFVKLENGAWFRVVLVGDAQDSHAGIAPIHEEGRDAQRVGDGARP